MTASCPAFFLFFPRLFDSLHLSGCYYVFMWFEQTLQVIWLHSHLFFSSPLSPPGWSMRGRACWTRTRPLVRSCSWRSRAASTETPRCWRTTGWARRESSRASQQESLNETLNAWLKAECADKQLVIMFLVLKVSDVSAGLIGILVMEPKTQ